MRSCPTWSWEAGDPGRAKPYLPPGKQYLVTRGVPCRRRANAVLGSAGLAERDVEGAGEEAWVETGDGTVDSGGAPEPIMEIGEREEAAGGVGAGVEVVDDDEEVPDIDALDIEDEAVVT